jgi:hypothetical protein
METDAKLDSMLACIATLSSFESAREFDYDGNGSNDQSSTCANDDLIELEDETCTATGDGESSRDNDCDYKVNEFFMSVAQLNFDDDNEDSLVVPDEEEEETESESLHLMSPAKKATTKTSFIFNTEITISAGNTIRG